MMNLRRDRSDTGRLGLAAWLALVSMLTMATAMWCQVLVGEQIILHPPIAYGNRLVVDIAESAPPTVGAEGDFDPDFLFPASASLKTDPDIDRLIQRAREFTQDERYDVAVALWQQVLDSSASALVTQQDWIDTGGGDRKHWVQIYRSVGAEVERVLAELPAGGLATYRLVADPQARGLLATAQGSREETALAEITRRYFISSVGDDAAFRLGCLLLDRHDFVGASRLFERILKHHPDPNVDRQQVLLRLAAATAGIADYRAAQQALDELRALAERQPLAVSREAIAAVERYVGRGQVASPTVDRGSGNWPMALGGPARDGRMRSLPPDAMTGPLSEAWSFRVEVFEGDVLPPTQVHPEIDDLRSSRIRPPVVQPVANQPKRRDLVEIWKQQAQTPVGQALLHNGKIIFRTYTKLVCLDTTSFDEPTVAWVAPPGGGTDPDDPSGFEDLGRLQQDLRDWEVLHASGNAAYPQFRQASYRAAMLLGDRTLQTLTAHDGMVYFVDAAPLLRADMRQLAVRAAGPIVQATPSLLTAIDVNSGKLRWQWPAQEDRKNEPDDFRLLGSPVPHGNLLILPVYANSGLWLYALEAVRSDGSDGNPRFSVQLAWKTSLCDDPEAGVDMWASVGMCLEGGDLYVASGRGVVLAVDAGSGVIRWAARYQRSSVGDVTIANRSGGMVRQAVFEGFEENFILARGKVVLLMAADHDHLLALDRRTGSFVWHSPREGAQYPLGVAGDALFVAGANRAARYHLPSGILEWVWKPQDAFGSTARSLGRGMLTENAIYLPVDDTIVRLTPEGAGGKGMVTGRVDVKFSKLDDREDPIGNLFTDGHTFFALGPDRMYALSSIEQQLTLLDRKVAEGETALRLKRALLRARLDRLPEAADDLRLVYAQRLESDGAADALAVLLDGIGQTQLTMRAPLAALDLTTGREGALAALSAEARENIEPPTRHRLFALLSSALSAVAEKQPAGAVSPVIDALLAWPDEGLTATASRAIRATARETDLPVLRQAIAAEPVPARAGGIVGLAAVLGARSADELSALLGDASEPVRLIAARELANLGDRRSLAVLVALLGSDDQSVRIDSIRVLQAATGERFDFIAYGSPQERAASLDEWKQWLDSEASSAELRVPLNLLSYRLGRILIADNQAGRLLEFDDEKNELWRSPPFVPLHGAWACQGLPNGHRLVSLVHSREVVELNRDAELVWRSGTLPVQPISIQRLENGHTLVGGRSPTRRDGVVIELGRDGQPIEGRTVNLSSQPSSIQLLDNGRLLVAFPDEHRVVEIDAQGNPVDGTQISGLVRPQSARRLQDGSTLVCDHGGIQTSARVAGAVASRSIGRVIEYDHTGKAVWTKDEGLQYVWDAARLENGRTLIVDDQGIRLVDRQGDNVWQLAISGARRASAY